MVTQHFSKRRVIIFMKVVEATLLVVATFAMFIGHVIAMLAVLFLLGIHACFLDPAKEGILPQIFPDEALSRANGLMQLTVYTMIVSGPVAAGLLPEQPSGHAPSDALRLRPGNNDDAENGRMSNQEA